MCFSFFRTASDRSKNGQLDEGILAIRRRLVRTPPSTGPYAAARTPRRAAPARFVSVREAAAPLPAERTRCPGAAKAAATRTAPRLHNRGSPATHRAGKVPHSEGVSSPTAIDAAQKHKIPHREGVEPLRRRRDATSMAVHTPPGAASTPSAPTGTTCARTRVPFASRIVLEYFNLSNVTTRLSCSSSELRYSDRALEHLAASVAPSPNVVVVSITPRVPLVRASEVNASRFALSSPLATPHVTSNVVVVVAPRPSPPVVSDTCASTLASRFESSCARSACSRVNRRRRRTSSATPSTSTASARVMDGLEIRARMNDGGRHKTSAMSTRPRSSVPRASSRSRVRRARWSSSSSRRANAANAANVARGERGIFNETAGDDASVSVDGTTRRASLLALTLAMTTTATSPRARAWP